MVRAAGLLGGEEAFGQPATDRLGADAELARGLVDRDALPVGGLAGCCGDGAAFADARDPRSGEREPGGGEASLLCEDHRDLGIGGVLGEPSDELDEVLAGARAFQAAVVEPDAQLAARPALPQQLSHASVSFAVNVDHDIGEQCAKEFLSVAIGRGRCGPHAGQIAGEAAQRFALRFVERGGAAHFQRVERSAFALDEREGLFERALKGTGDV